MSDVDTLIRASRLYYELGETQERIATLLGVTRPQVSRILKRARSEGIVEIRIHDGSASDSPAGEQLREAFGLSAIHLAPALDGPDDLKRRMAGRLAARVLRSRVRDGAVIGVGPGATMRATAEALDEGAEPVDATVVPLTGGYWWGDAEREAFRIVADRLGARSVALLAPGLVDDATTQRALRRHVGVRRMEELWAGLDLAIVGVGGRTWRVESVGETAFAELEAARAIGEVLIAPFDVDGRFVGDSLRARTVGFDPRDLRRVPVRIGVAAGADKAAPVLGALRAGILTELVVDVLTADAVVARLAEAPL